MTNGYEGRVYWSAGGRRFYQEGRRGAVSTEEAVSHLTQDERGRFRDELGRFVPDAAIQAADIRVRRFTTVDASNRPYITAEFRDKLTTRQEYNQQRLEGNKMLVVRTVVRTPDGRTHVSYTSSKLGAGINVDGLDKLADRRTSGQLRGDGYEIKTNAIGNVTVGREYIIRTVNTRR